MILLLIQFECIWTLFFESSLKFQDWIYEDMPTPTQLKERKARRKAKRLKERKEKREKRRAARKVRE